MQNSLYAKNIFDKLHRRHFGIVWWSWLNSGQVLYPDITQNKNTDAGLLKNVSIYFVPTLQIHLSLKNNQLDSFQIKCQVNNANKTILFAKK